MEKPTPNPSVKGGEIGAIFTWIEGMWRDLQDKEYKIHKETGKM